MYIRIHVSHIIKVILWMIMLINQWYFSSVMSVDLSSRQTPTSYLLYVPSVEVRTHIEFENYPK